MHVPPLLARFTPLLPLLLLAGCPANTGFQKPPEEDTPDTGATDTDTAPIDTEDTDGDLDDDGFTPAEGDCDDASVYVSPAREEETDDGLDNDCDGRTDEKWSGFDVGRVNDDGVGSIITLDTIGRDDAEVPISAGCRPDWLDHFGDGWAVSSGYSAVGLVDAGGTCTLLADFSDTEVYEFGVWGIATQIDGTLLATTVGSLVSVATDGTVTPLAEWVVNLDDPAVHEFAAVSAAVDPATGEVGLFDYFGGFGTWSAETGLTIHRKGDYSAPTLYTASGTHRDGGGWYAPGADAATGAYGVYHFDLDAGDWVLDESWDEATWTPHQVAIDGDSGDWYVTANANGVFPTVWRIVEGTGYAADFFVIETDYAGYLYGITTNYTYGE